MLNASESTSRSVPSMSNMERDVCSTYTVGTGSIVGKFGNTTRYNAATHNPFAAGYVPSTGTRYIGI